MKNIKHNWFTKLFRVFSFALAQDGEVAVEYAHSPEIAEVIAAASPGQTGAGEHNESSTVDSIGSHSISSLKFDTAVAPQPKQPPTATESIILSTKATSEEPTGDAQQDGGENKFDTIELEIEANLDQSGKTAENSTTSTAATNQCCVVM